MSKVTIRAAMAAATSPDVGLKLEEHFNEVIKMSRTGQGGQRKIGLLTGAVIAHLLHFVDDYLIEMTVTVGVAYGVYLLGTILNTSGLLAVVGAGLVLGNYGRRTGMSERTRQVTQDIWEFFGYLANSFLFLLLGIHIGERNLIQALAGIGLAVAGVLISRAVMISTLLPLHNTLIL